MSGASGIRGSGGGSVAGGFSGRRENASRFRRGRSIGDTVRGIFLRPETRTLCWVDIEGTTMLALLPALEEAGDAGFPQPGSEMFFTVEALEPEIVLRLADGESGRTARGRSAFTGIAALPLARQASLYATARDNLDSLLHDMLWPAFRKEGVSLEGMDAGSLREAFITFVGSHAQALELYARTRLWSETVTVACRGAGLTRFRHLPWLCPVGRAVEGALLSWNGDTTILVGMRLPSGLSIGLQGHVKGRVFFYTLLLPQDFEPDSQALTRITANLAETLPGPDGGTAVLEMRCLSVTRTSSANPDLLASLLARCAGTGQFAARRRFSRHI